MPASRPLNGFQVADLSFVGRHGWALGTAGCVPTSGRCSALAGTADNGRTWRSIAVPPVHVRSVDLDAVPCADPCVDHVRFATERVGYLFGATALFMTVNGGQTWRRQSGGADALETLDGNVIRVADQGGCPPGCTYSISIGSIGGTSWSRVTLPGPSGPGVGVALVRTGAHAYVESFGNPAGGGNARSVLWSSSDDGRHWTNRGEPCPQVGGDEFDGRLLTSAPDGAVSVLCRGRAADGRQFIATSIDGGAHFRTRSTTALGAAEASAVAAVSASSVLVSTDDLYLSGDGGRRFARLSANSGSSPGALVWLGFASATVGHGISIGRRTIWTTTDGGHSWWAGVLR